MARALKELLELARVLVDENDVVRGGASNPIQVAGTLTTTSAAVPLQHVPLFAGSIYYVDGTAGSDANAGTSPTTAFATIGAGIAAASAGDAITVKAATYDEAGLNLNKASLELWLEAGTILQDSADGTVLTASAFGCVVRGSGNIRIDPTGGATGVLVSGNFVYLENLRVNANDVGGIGYDITGNGTEVHDCRCSAPATAAYKVQGDKTLLENCCTGGTTATGTIGFWVTNSCDKARLRLCGSQGHSTAGYQVDAGCTNGVVQNCTSGGGDGERTDAGTLFHWPNFESVSAKEEHYHVYPAPDGEGTAGDPHNVTTDAADETNGPASTANYWGESHVLIAPSTVTVLWSLFGLNLHAVTANKVFFHEMMRINAGKSSAKNAGNAWDEGATALTVADGSVFQANDLVWIYSDYETDGEIMKVTDVTGNVVTVAREASQYGAANTGLRWDHTTNDPGTEVMYLAYRPTSWGMHCTNVQSSFGSARDSAIEIFPHFRQFNANDGLLIRSCGQTDDTNGASTDMSVIYREGAH